MYLSDSELCMLEQLTYLNGSVAEKAKIKGYVGINANRRGCSVRELLTQFDEASLEELAKEKKPIDGAEASGEEWARIIRYLKSSEIGDLVLKDVMPNASGKTNLAICFEDSKSPNEAIVAFKGTTGKEEWEDNVEGLNVSGTKCQKEALDFIERLPYDNITVTGHSKGGNKAMYVSITSDKITRCVSFDGQGFSQEFIDKYWAEIQLRGGNISNYSLSTDFVHILLFPVPGSNQQYCQGFGVSSLPENHSPNSFFACDENGDLILDAFGQPIFLMVEEDASMTMLHRFTAFIINNANGTDKEIMVEYISGLLGRVFGGSGMGKDELIDYILSDPDAFALILAYLVKYMEVNNLGSGDIDILLDTLGLNSLNELIEVFEFGDYVVTVDLVNVINYMKMELTDGGDDKIVRFIILPVLKYIFARDYDINVTELWEKIDSTVADIDSSGGCEDAVARTGVVRDFSKETYNKIMETISRIDSMNCFSVNTWKQYYGEEWFSSLDLTLMMNGINSYISSVVETNQECKAKVDEIFNNVCEIDKEVSRWVREEGRKLERVTCVINEKADMILV